MMHPLQMIRERQRMTRLPPIDSSHSSGDDASWSSGDGRWPNERREEPKSVEHELLYAGVPLSPVFFYKAEEDPSVHSLRYSSRSSP